ncbi:MAG: hypothetical protein ACK5JR_10775 [Tropicimonas sp.]|uniref:hypothetical protein n=1 Tax=Tropicimonas sp. TaxID=2067044 RepID=UPI003A837611
MKTALLTIATIAAFTVQAQASDQLALSLGLAPGQYSTAQLAQLMDAKNNESAGRYAELLNSFDASSSGTGNYSQLGASVGAAADNYTLPELARARAAMDADNSSALQQVTKERTIISTGGPISGGRRQLATSQGVDPSDYTLAQLAEMHDD